MPEPLLIGMSGVGKVYPVGDRHLTVLKEVNLEVRHGEFIAIMGKSGSGKSTLLYLLGCMDLPTAGRYDFNGTAVAGLDDVQLSLLRNKSIGFIFQTFNLIHTLNVFENVVIPLHYAGLPPAERAPKCIPLIEKVGLADRITHTPSQLSGGEMQRVAIARALVNDPLLILADEPTGNLDSATSAEIMQLIQELNRQGKTVIMVTHDRNIAAFAKRTVHIQDGILSA